MPVIVQYIVVRDGDEKMTFATKKEADAYDRMLDIADNLFDFLGHSDLDLDDVRKEELSLLFAEKRDEVMPILRGAAPKLQKERKKTAASVGGKTRGKAGARQVESVESPTASDSKADSKSNGSGSSSSSTVSSPSSSSAKPAPKSAAQVAASPKRAPSKKSGQAG